MNAEIISVGTELLLGDILNTDTRFLSKELSLYGINVFFQSTVGDNAARLRSVLESALSRADLIITSGGLGPTADDLTRETVSETLGIPLRLHEESFTRMKEYFKRIDRDMPENNKKQAMLPEGCTVFPNEFGTAPGCAVLHEGKCVIMLPGPPKELEPMFVGSVLPYLSQFSDGVIHSETLNIFGMGESKVEQLIARLMESSNPTVAPYAKMGEVQVRVTAKANDAESGKAICRPVVDQIKQYIGSYVYGENVDSLQQVVVRELQKKKFKISTAESCSAGLLSKRITDIPGSSSVFEVGVAAYANEKKTEMLGVKAETLAARGAVSAEVAAAMARGALAVSGADLAVGITGLAGPDGGTDEKPVGLVYIALCNGGKIWVKKLVANAKGTREYIRNISTSHALDMVRRYLEDPIDGLADGIMLEINKDTGPELKAFIQESASEKEKKAKRGFWASLFPRKGDGPGEVIRKIVFLLAVLLFLGSVGYFAYDQWYLPMINQQKYESLGQLYYPGDSSRATGGWDYPVNIEYPEGMLDEFKALYAKNQDIKGWISIPDTPLDYPIVQASDNDYYLRRDFDKNYSVYGVPFFDYRNKIAKDDVNRNIIVYGHYVQNHIMFGSVERYKDLSYYREHPIVNMDTIYNKNNYKIISVFYASTNPAHPNNFYYIRTDFQDDQDFGLFIKEVQMRSIFNIPVDVNENDQLLTISTCSHIFDDARMVIVARKVRPDEPADVSVSDASVNTECLMPDIWKTLNPGKKYPGS